MKNSKLIRSITLGGILTALYAIITFLSVYSIVPLLSVFSLMIMPIFAAYYSSTNSFKTTLCFNIATMIVSFLIALSDPFYTILYVLPSLIVGDMFGLFNKLKLKYYTTIFLQSIVFSITNILALVLAEKFYEIKIIEAIISDKWIYENLSFSILFILSGAEAIFSSLFIFEKLKKFNMPKHKEKVFPEYGYIAICILTILAIISYFVSNNLYFLFIVMIFILSIPIVDNFIKKIKHFSFILLVYFLISVPLELLVCSKSLYNLVALIAISPISVYAIVKVVIYIYNINKER